MKMTAHIHTSTIRPMKNSTKQEDRLYAVEMRHTISSDTFQATVTGQDEKQAFLKILNLHTLSYYKPDRSTLREIIKYKS